MLPDIHRRIVNAKYVFEKAVGIQAENNEMSLSISLLLMHDAIELLMIAVLDHVKASTKKKRDFMDFWADMKQAGQVEPSDFIPMESLNKLRVGLKHNGNIPNPQTVRELIPRARGFFENVLSTYCNLRYNEVSLLDRIADTEVRDLLRGALVKFESNDKLGAMTDLKIALYKIEYPRDKYIPRIQAPKAPSIPSLGHKLSDIEYELKQYVRSLHEFLELSAARTNALTFDFDPLRYARFSKYGPAIYQTMDGAFHANHWGNYDDVTTAVFEELVEFLVDYSLKLRDVYQPIVHSRPYISQT